MTTEVEQLDQMIRQLPADSRAEVRDFVESLMKKKKESNAYLRQTWAGALETYREQSTSFELQQKSTDWC